MKVNRIFLSPNDKSYFTCRNFASNSTPSANTDKFDCLDLSGTPCIVLALALIHMSFFSISWFKDGEPYPWTNFGSSLPILFGKNQSLVIVNMTPKDEGQYKCVASNVDDVSNTYSIACKSIPFLLSECL